MPNRLAAETSPYLLQHRNNPVDWYPWGPEAFEASRSQNKSIFLSVGYSTCYWCHVMERQCFEVEAIATLMNRWFINIKVDREERPDVDQLYMTAVQLLTRQGGWPMSVFLLPDRRPFYGGTYFPPTDGHGRPGFPRLLEGLHDAFENRLAEVERTATELTAAITEIAGGMESPAAGVLDRKTVDRLIDRSTADYDPQLGGFGSAPKFPRETLLELLLRRNRRGGDAARVKQIRHTLDAMADGGIRDQLGGGFHRYSTDARWLVPHFEIMLYDNAMLAWIYAEAHRQFGGERYGRVARGICDFVLREMTDANGPFYTAFDAEVDGREGLNYLWTETEIDEALTPSDAAVFKRVYGIDEGPNFADPHHGDGRPEANILHLPHGPGDEFDPRMTGARNVLLAVRAERKQPLLDTKILTSWNALMIRGLGHAGEMLGEPRYTAAAGRAAEWLLQHHVADGKLLRTSRDGKPAKLDGSLDDYAFLVHALLSIHRPGDARRLLAEMRSRFRDDRTGVYFFTDKSSDELFARQVITSDSPLPSGNGIVAQALVELGELEEAKQLLKSTAGSLQRNGSGMSALLQAADVYIEAAGIIDAPAPRGVVPSSNEPVTISTNWADDRTLIVNLAMAPGYHINASDAAGDLIKTEIIATPAAEIKYPTPTSVAKNLVGYAGRIDISVRWATAPADENRLHVRFQACTDMACLAPTTRIIESSRP